MVIAALASFAVLALAWVVAPCDTTQARAEPIAAHPATPESEREAVAIAA